MKKILITGAKGFLGSSAAKHFKGLGYETYGIGHAVDSRSNVKQVELDYWIKGNVSTKAILGFQKKRIAF